MAILNPNPYKLDPTGSLAANRVVDEQHIVTFRNHKDFHFIVPKFAPFFEKNMVVKFQETGTRIPEVLVFNKDYYFTHHFHQGSLSVASPLYGSITLLRREMQGVITLEYNPLGGDWCVDEATIQRILADRIHNPRITYWDQVAELPYRFPVTNHDWNIKDMYGGKEIVRSILSIADELRNKAVDEAGYQKRLKLLLSQLTKDRVGLSHLENLPILPESRWNDTSEDYYMTPRATQKMIKEVALEALKSHAGESNPHGLTVTDLNTLTAEEIRNLVKAVDKKVENLIDTGVDTDTLDKIKQWIRDNPITNADTLGGKTLTEILNGPITATALGTKSAQQVFDMIAEAARSGGTSQGMSPQERDNLQDLVDKFEDFDLALIDAATLNNKSYNELMSDVGNRINEVRTSRQYSPSDISETDIIGVMIPIATQTFIDNPLTADNSPSEFSVFNLNGFSTSFTNTALSGISLDTDGIINYNNFTDEAKYKRELANISLDTNIGIKKLKNISDSVEVKIYNEYTQSGNNLFSTNEVLGILNRRTGGLYYNITSVPGSDPRSSVITYYLFQRKYHKSGDIKQLSKVNGVSISYYGLPIQIREDDLNQYTRITNDRVSTSYDTNGYNALVNTIKNTKDKISTINFTVSNISTSLARASSNSSKALTLATDLSKGFIRGDINSGNVDLSSGTLFISNNITGFENVNTDCEFTVITNIDSLKNMLKNTSDFKVFFKSNNLAQYTVYESSNAEDFPEFISNTEKFIFRMVCTDRNILCVI